MTPSDMPAPVLGDDPRHRQFASKYPDFVTAYQPNTERLIHAFQDAITAKGSEIIMYTLGVMALEGWPEIIILCANGYTSGALKILRPMYEHSVTLAYLARHRDEIPRFINYRNISNHKEVVALESAFPGSVSAERVRAARASYDAHAKDYKFPVCDTCAEKASRRVARMQPLGDLCTHTRNFAWTKKALHELAREAGGFEQIAPVAYHLPIQELHATMAGVQARLDIDLENKKVSVRTGQTVRDDRLTLFLAHYLIMRVLEVFRDVFSLEDVEADLWATCEDDLRKHRDSLLTPLDAPDFDRQESKPSA